MVSKKKKDPKDNLIANPERTPKELKNMAKKGGKKSGQVRRQRKQLKDLFLSMLSTPIPQDELKEKITSMGLDGEEKNYNTLLGMTTLNEALKGNMRAVELIRDTIGEKPVENVELRDNSKLDKILEQIEGKDE